MARIRMVVNLDLNGTGEEGITVVNATAQQAVYDQLVAISEDPSASASEVAGPGLQQRPLPFCTEGHPGHLHLHEGWRQPLPRCIRSPGDLAAHEIR